MLGLSYWMIPLLSALVWLAMLAAMLGTWLADGSPHYPSMGARQHIAFISDVGAAAPYPDRSGLKPLFIAMSSVTVVLLDVAFLLDRWLRHRGRLAPNTKTSEKVLSVIGCLFAIAGAAGIILLSIFDTYNHPRLHDGFLLLFIGGYIIAAIFVCAEYQRLGVHQRTHRILAISFWIKLAFIIIEIALAIAFVVENFRGNPNVAAVLEWTIALIYTGWILSFCVDLWPARRSKHDRFSKEADEAAVSPERYTENHPAPGTYSAYSGSTAAHEPAYHGDGSRKDWRNSGRLSPGPQTAYAPPANAAAASSNNIGAAY